MTCRLLVLYIRENESFKSQWFVFVMRPMYGHAILEQERQSRVGRRRVYDSYNRRLSHSPRLYGNGVSVSQRPLAPIRLKSHSMRKMISSPPRVTKQRKQRHDDNPFNNVLLTRHDGQTQRLTYSKSIQNGQYQLDRTRRRSSCPLPSIQYKQRRYTNASPKPYNHGKVQYKRKNTPPSKKRMTDPLNWSSHKQQIKPKRIELCELTIPHRRASTGRFMGAGAGRCKDLCSAPSNKYEHTRCNEQRGSSKIVLHLKALDEYAYEQFTGNVWSDSLGKMVGMSHPVHSQHSTDKENNPDRLDPHPPPSATPKPGPAVKSNRASKVNIEDYMTKKETEKKFNNPLNEIDPLPYPIAWEAECEPALCDEDSVYAIHLSCSSPVMRCVETHRCVFTVNHLYLFLQKSMDLSINGEVYCIKYFDSYDRYKDGVTHYKAPRGMERHVQTHHRNTSYTLTYKNAYMDRLVDMCFGNIRKYGYIGDVVIMKYARTCYGTLKPYPSRDKDDGKKVHDVMKHDDRLLFESITPSDFKKTWELLEKGYTPKNAISSHPDWDHIDDEMLSPLERCYKIITKINKIENRRLSNTTGQDDQPM